MPIDWKRDYEPTTSMNNDGTDPIRWEDVVEKIDSAKLEYEDTARKCFLTYIFL